MDAVHHPFIISTLSGSRHLDGTCTTTPKAFPPILALSLTTPGPPTACQVSAGELTESDGVLHSRLERGVLLFTPGARTPTPLYYQVCSICPLSYRRKTFRGTSAGGTTDALHK